MRQLTPLLLLSVLSLPSLAQTFTVGVVPQFDIKTLHTIWNPILLELHKQTGHTFELRGAPDIPSFERAIDTGEYDFAYMNPFHYTVTSHYTPLVRDYGRQLYGVLAVRKEGNIRTIADLNNQTIVFPAPNALGASLLMRAELTDKFGLTFTPRYVKTHSSVFLNVALDLAAAGGGVQKTFNQQPDEVRSRLQILHTTQKVTPHPFTANLELPQSIRQQVQAALLSLSVDPEGQALLSHIPMRKAGIAYDSDYDSIRALNLGEFYVAPQRPSP